MVQQVKDGRSIWSALDPVKVVVLDDAATNLAAEAIEVQQGSQGYSLWQSKMPQSCTAMTKLHRQTSCKPSNKSRKPLTGILHNTNTIAARGQTNMT
jgi:hypothetical protein